MAANVRENLQGFGWKAWHGAVGIASALEPLRPYDPRRASANDEGEGTDGVQDAGVRFGLRSVATMNRTVATFSARFSSSHKARNAT